MKDNKKVVLQKDPYGTINYVLVILISITTMSYYYFESSYNEVIDTSKELFFSFLIISIFSIILSLIILLKSIIKKKMSVFGLALPIFSLLSEYAILFIYSQIYHDDFLNRLVAKTYNITLILCGLMICVVAAIVLIIAYVLNNIVLRVIASVVIAMANLINLYIYIIMIRFGFTSIFYILCTLSLVLYALSFVLVIIKLFAFELSNNNSIDSNNLYKDSVSELKEYKELLDIGAITQKEFETKKKELLNLD